MICLFLGFGGMAQKPFFTTPQGLNVCQESRLQAGMLNDGNSTLNNIQIRLKLPCGLEYLQSSVRGLAEVDVSDPNQALFILDSLEPGDSIRLSWDVLVSCRTVNCIDGGELFQHALEIRNGNQSTQYLSPIYNVETAYPVIHRLEDPLFKAAKGDVLERKITIRNTRPGRLERFEFTDTHTKGVIIEIPGRDTISTSPGHISVEIGAADFQKIGNRDAFFDFNEEIVITERIHVVSCAFDQRYSQSHLKVNWGCDSNLCQSYGRRAKVQIESKFDEGDVLKTWPVKQEVYCQEGGEDITQLLELTHEGVEGDLYNVRVHIYQLGDGYSISQGSFRVNALYDTVIYSKPSGDICAGTGYKQAVLHFSDFPIGGKIQIEWDTRACIEGCGMGQNAWSYSYSYDKECAPPDEKYISRSGPNVGSRDSAAIDAIMELQAAEFPLTRGDTALLVQKISHPLLTAGSGNIRIQLRMPCVFLPLNNTYLLGGKAPVKTELSSDPVHNTMILEYALPFSSADLSLSFPVVLTCDAVCAGGNCFNKYISSCPKDCSGNKAVGKIQRNIAINPGFQCAEGDEVKLCDDIDFEYICLDQPCEVIVLGYLDYDLNIYRTNFGLPDNDNDHQPDASGQIDRSKVALKHVMQGDTFVYDFKGVVIEDVPGKARFSHGLLTMRAEMDDFRHGNTQDDPELYLDNFFNEEQKIRMLSTSLKIYDQSEGKTFFLNKVPVFYDPFLNDIDFSLNCIDLALNNPGFPANFLYEKGDSIHLQVTNILDFNFPNRTGKGSEMDIKLDHKGYLDTLPINKKRTFHCRCESDYLSVRAFIVNPAYNTRPSRDYCEQQFRLFDMYFHLHTDQLREDFPYEIRSPFMFSSLNIELGDDLVLDSTRFRLQKGNNAGFTIPGDQVHIQFEDYINPVIDEYFLPEFLFYGMGDECIGRYSDEKLDLEIILAPQDNPQYFDTLIFDITPNLRKQPQPRLDPLVNLPFVESRSDTLRWEYNILVSSTNSLHTWFRVEKRPTYELLELSSVKHPILSVGKGIYQLGEIPQGDTVQLMLTLLAKSCKEIEVPVSFGSGCQPKTKSIQPSCVEATDQLFGYVLKGKAENFIESREIEIPLCNSEGSLTTTIFNADRGHLKNITSTLEPPPGFSLISGSVELAYPTGSGRWHAIADPDILADSTYRWNWNRLDTSIFKTGLKGINNIPENGFDLRYDFTTDCDFLSGSKLIFRTVGENYCGQNSNTIAKVSGAVHIEGVDPSYNSSIGLIEFTEADCGQEGHLVFTVSTSGNPQLLDSLYVQKPEGYLFKDGSAPFSPRQNGNLLSWGLDSVLTLDSFYCSFLAEDGLSCGQDILSVYTATKDSAFCVADSNLCEIEVINGRIDLPVFYLLPEIQVNSLRLTGQSASDLYTVEIELENISQIPQNGIEIDFYLDTDNVPGFSENDSFVFSHLNPELIRAGTTASFVLDSLFMPLSGFCKLMAVVPKNSNCLCQGDYTYMQTPITLRTDSLIRACPEEFVDIGIEPVSGFSYQWREQGLVSCDTCPQTSFYAENGGQNPRIYDFTLIAEEAEGCRFEYRIEAEIQPFPRLLSDEQTICPGDTIFMLSTEGVSYSWEGEGIVSIEENTMLAAPQQSGYFSVEVSDAFGCTARDSIFVKVLPEAIADAGPDKLYCFGEIGASLEAEYYDGLQYRWLYAENTLEDHLVASTDIIVETSREYVLEVFNGLCVDYDTVYVEYEKGIELSGLPDSLIECVGTVMDLSVSGGDIYRWIPYYNGMCADTFCSDVRLEMPYDSFTVRVIGQDEKGCVDTLRAYLKGYIDTPFLQLDTNLCLYETLQWRHFQISEEGTYCDTIPLKGKCAEITCLDVHYIEMDTLILYDTLCLGDSTVFFDQTIKNDGIYFFQPDSVTCDTVYRLKVSYFEKVEDIADSTLLLKDMCEDLLIYFPDIFENYSWQPTEGLDCIYCASPYVTNNAVSDYSVLVEDIHGCQEEFFFSIGYERCRDRDIYIPNIFTPNEDGRNDVFTVYPRKNVLSIENMKIFNRWGAMIFEYRGTGDISVLPAWDGRFRGKYCDQGTYVYILKVKWQDGTITDFAGDITLDR